MINYVNTFLGSITVKTDRIVDKQKSTKRKRIIKMTNFHYMMISKAF